VRSPHKVRNGSHDDDDEHHERPFELLVTAKHHILEDDVIASYDANHVRHIKLCELAAAASRRTERARLGAFLAAAVASYIVWNRSADHGLTIGVILSGLLGFGPRGTLLLVTGSNMAGKSTLLCTIGLNGVPAQFGHCQRYMSTHIKSLHLKCRGAVPVLRHDYS
jgi:hypothetical protein